MHKWVFRIGAVVATVAEVTALVMFCIGASDEKCVIATAVALGATMVLALTAKPDDNGGL